MTFPELKGCGGSNISLSPAQINAKKKKKMDILKTPQYHNCAPGLEPE